jgi:hypothetical protein
LVSPCYGLDLKYPPKLLMACLSVCDIICRWCILGHGAELGEIGYCGHALEGNIRTQHLSFFLFLDSQEVSSFPLPSLPPYCSFSS